MARLKNTTYAALSLGLALAIGLIVWQGIDAIAAVLAVAGWSLILLGLYQIAPILMAALSWRPLLPGDPHRRLTELTAVTWIGLSVNWLLPVAQVGGDLLRARLLSLGGANGAAAGASVVVDKTIQAVAQVAFSLLGLILLIAVAGAHTIAYWVAGFAAVLSACLYVFFKLQRQAPAGRILALLRRAFPGAAFRDSLPDGSAFDAALDGLYRQRSQIALSILWRCAERLAKAGEV